MSCCKPFTFTLLSTFLTSLISLRKSLGSSNGKSVDFFQVCSAAAGTHGKTVTAQSASRCLLKKTMLSEGKEQFHVCIVWGGKSAPPAPLQDTSEDTTYPESSFVSLNEKSV